MKGTILLAGVHGVGKSTAAEKLTKHFGIPNFTASKIIKSVKSSSVNEVHKKVDNVADNQKLLLKGISQHLEQNDIIILDGHFTLLNSDLKIVKISESVFESLRLVGVLLLMENPNIIFERQTIRDANALPLHLIIESQREELEHAHYVTSKLCIPLMTINHYTDDRLFDGFRDLIKNLTR